MNAQRAPNSHRGDARMLIVRAMSGRTLDVPERVRLRLEKLRSMSEPDSLTEVVRRAVSIYDVLLTAVGERGDMLMLRAADGTERDAFIP